jgi:nonsense-mediated mRNA decay protein 3
MGRCIKCGKSGEFRLFCEDCYLKDHPLVAGIGQVEIRVCFSCGKYLQKNKWKEAKTLDTAISESITDKLSLSKEYAIKGVRVTHNLGKIVPKPGLRLKGEAAVAISAYSEEDKIDVHDEYIVPFDIVFASCGKCGLAGSQYFEGILQIRNARPELVEKIAEYAKRDIDAGSHINKVESGKGGTDFYMTSNHHLKKLGIDIQKKFGGELEISPRLQTHDGLTSKDLYRLTVLLRFSDVVPGDFIEHKGRVIHVKKTGKEIIGRDTLDNTNVRLDPQKEAPKPLEIIKTVITKVKPQIEAMDPTTYQSTKVENAKREKLGQKVQVVAVSGKLFLVNTPHQN